MLQQPLTLRLPLHPLEQCPRQLACLAVHPLWQRPRQHPRQHLFLLRPRLLILVLPMRRQQVRTQRLPARPLRQPPRQCLRLRLLQPILPPLSLLTLPSTLRRP